MQSTRPRVCLILIGESQTGKSSLINHLARKYICEVGDYGSGVSCTKKSAAYQITRSNGQQVMLIDTVGFNDSNAYVTDKNTSDNFLNQLVNEFMPQISQFGPQHIVFVMTESCTGSTIQLGRNLDRIQKMFGQVVTKSCVVVATKYNFENVRSDCSAQEKKRYNNRITALQEELQAFNSNYCQTVPVCQFYTHVWKNRSIDTENSLSSAEYKSLLDNQEKVLFQTIDQTKSFPTDLILRVRQYADEKIKQLYNTVGIGYQTTQKLETYYETVTKSRTVRREIEYNDGEKLVFGLITLGTLGLLRPKEYTYETEYYDEREPRYRTVNERKQIRSMQECKEYFEKDAQCQKEKNQFIEQLFKQYSK